MVTGWRHWCVKARITRKPVKSRLACPQIIKLELLSCFFLLFVSFHYNRLWACETRPKDQIRNRSGEHLFFLFLTPLCYLFPDALCPFQPSAPAAWKQLEGFYSGLNLCSLSEKPDKSVFVLWVYNRCSVSLLLTSALDCLCSNVDGKKGVRADRSHHACHSVIFISFFLLHLFTVFMVTVF